MFTIVLPAKNIPDRTEVRKVPGKVLYRLHKEVSIFGPEDGPLDKPRKTVIAESDLNYLIGDNCINAVHDSLRLAIDFQNLEDMQEFIEESLSFTGDGCGE